MKKFFLLLGVFAFLGLGCGEEDKVDYQKKLAENADKWQAQVLSCPQAADYDEDDKSALQDKVDEYKKDFYSKCYKTASDLFDCVLKWECPQLILFTNATLGIGDEDDDWMGSCSKSVVAIDKCIMDASIGGDDDDDDE